MKLRKDVVWMALWIIISNVLAFLTFSVCEDRTSRFGVGILVFLVVIFAYGGVVVTDFKSGVMPINKKTFYYFETLIYMVINFFSLAYLPDIYVSILIFTLAIFPRIIHRML